MDSLTGRFNPVGYNTLGAPCGAQGPACAFGVALRDEGDAARSQFVWKLWEAGITLLLT